MSFRITGLDPEQFAPLLALSGEELAARNIVRMIVDKKPGFPCRVALKDAEPGETVLLLNYEHLPVSSPFRSKHAIFVSGATERYDRAGAVPPALRGRLLSVRSFDDAGMMLDADVVDGNELEPLLERFLGEPRAAYLHVHNAKYGCYLARAERAE